MRPETRAERARVNRVAGKARERELKDRKARKDRANDPLRHKRLAHNPLGADDPAMIYWRTKDGATFAERKPTSRVSVQLRLEDAAELERVAEGAGETVAAYAARILAGHARGLRNSRRAKPKPPAPAPVTPAQQLEGQLSIT